MSHTESRREGGSPANTKHLYNICTMLYQRRRRWADVVQMLYKRFVFSGRVHWHAGSATLTQQGGLDWSSPLNLIQNPTYGHFIKLTLHWANLDPRPALFHLFVLFSLFQEHYSFSCLLFLLTVSFAPLNLIHKPTYCHLIKLILHWANLDPRPALFHLFILFLLFQELFSCLLVLFTGRCYNLLAC